MPFIEAPTTFYLGKRYDPERGRLADEVIYYDSRDLTTHAVVVGMTGSGKTGMCISLLEEAMLDNIPAIVIDPKGDITNLALIFPQLRPADFEPWINPGDAQRAGLEPSEYAQEVAAMWREGLASWSISPARLNALKNAAQLSIYTPGSDAGLPISILASFAAPKGGWLGNEEFYREQISGVVTALMALIGKQVEPVKDREHVLISNIFEEAWKNGRDLTLEDIIIQVQNPPFARLGVFDVNTFFPEKDRFKLAKELNHIIAAPSFQTWITGEPLDVRRLLYTPEGRAKVSIFYLAHLTDAERTFMITLILENMIAWMRSLSGTTSLRALLYFDELFGHMPPAPRNPPTKEPLLRLLKTARAFGLGLILATQNPGDLDYKGLANAGTWFIGKLQTENDKRRVLGGLEAAATASTQIDTKRLDSLISGLAPRVFVVHNVHNESGPQLVHSRWAMSYLRGPLTRQQVRTLMEPQRAQMGLPNAGVNIPSGSQPMAPVAAAAAPPPAAPAPPIDAPAPITFTSAMPPSLPGERPAAPAGPPQTLPGERPANLPTLNPTPAPAAAPPPPAPPAPGSFLDRLTRPAPQTPPPPPTESAPRPFSLFNLPAAPVGGGTPTATPGYTPADDPQQIGSSTYGQPVEPDPAPPAPSPSYIPPEPSMPPLPQTYFPPEPQAPQQPTIPQAPQMPPAPIPQGPMYSSGETMPVGLGGTPPMASTQGASLPNTFDPRPPALPPSTVSYFLPVVVGVQAAIRTYEQKLGLAGSIFGGAQLVYQPLLMAQMGVRYLDRKSGVEADQHWAFHVPDVQAVGFIRWSDHQAPPVDLRQLGSAPAAEVAGYGQLSAGLTDAKRMRALRDEVIDFVARSATLVLWFNPTLQLYGTPGEDQRDFVARAAQKAREARDAEIDTVTARYEKEMDAIEARIKRAERNLEGSRNVLDELRREDLYTTGEAAVSLFRGRTAYTLSRMSRTRRYKKEAQGRVSTAEQELIDLEESLEAKQNELASALQAVNEKWRQIANRVEEYRVKPFKKDIVLEVFGIGWVPQWYVILNGSPLLLPAFVGTLAGTGQ